MIFKVGALRRSGITLVEIIIAFSILAVALIPVFSMLQSGSQKTAFSDYYIFAHIRASKIIEAKAALPYDQLAEQSTIAAVEDFALTDEYEMRLRPERYEESWIFNPTADPHLGWLEVIITWKFKLADEHRTYKLKRLVRNKKVSLIQEFNLQP